MAGSAVTPVVVLFTLSLAACAIPTDAAGRRSAPPGREDEELPGLYMGYDAASAPHWGHLRMQMTDYRIQYLSDASARSAEYAWSAEHFDRLILDWGDTRSVPEYRRVMPRAELYRYVLTWTVALPGSSLPTDPAVTYYAHMQQWYARHPEYQLENAFLHDAGVCDAASKSPACRLSVHIWSSDRWIVNPGDAGLRAYNRERLAAIASDVDGLFIDEHSSGDMADRLASQAILEYPDWSVYQRDIVQLIRDVRAAVGGKQLLLNTYNYTTPWDVEMTVAAGGAHGEAFNNPVYPEMERRWRHIEALLAAGASMNMLPQGGTMPSSYTAGSFDTPAARRRVWELASYYLVAPRQPGLLFLNSIGDLYDEPFADRWLGAVEANIGVPVDARRVFAEGVDGTGRPYRVWAREYERALVLVRPVIERGANSYGDETAVDIRLPTPERFRPLDADGRLDAAVEAIQLRAGEAAILVKEARVPGV
jgi:hypothetical protein